ncbi:MAG: hypothetical protein GX591_08500 [Planctomycetes bacterium]|nr:hypothetical protein [Planctomycetota bacterium]
MDNGGYQKGITFVSLAAILCGLLTVTVVLQWDSLVLGTGSFCAEHSVPMPPVIAIVLLTLIAAPLWRLGRIRLLNRAELLCVMFAMLIATPLVTQGFWHRYLSITLTMTDDPSTFKNMRCYPTRLWPHGKNLLADAYDPANRSSITTTGTVAWEAVELEPGRSQEMPVLRNDSPDGSSSLRIHLAAEQGGRRRFTPGEPFFVSVLARPGTAPKFALNPSSRYACRLRGPGGSTFAEVFSTSGSGEVTFVQKGGFVHLGSSSVDIPASAADEVIVEFTLDGVGQVALAEPWMMNNDALASALRGRQVVTESQYAQLPPAERGALVVRPDSLWSFKGVLFLLSGFIPVARWVEPLLWWLGFFLLLLTASLAMNVLLRRQWMENERYPMPLARIPMALIGYGSDDLAADLRHEGALPRIWLNRMMWAGLAVGGLWTLMRAWHFYNPKVPDLSIYVPLKPYFSDPGYGEMWTNVYFMVSALFVSLAMFMELNVLGSLVVGFFVHRSLFWLGHSSGLNKYAGFPFAGQQEVGAFAIYAVLTLIFMRKYLWRILRAALTNDKAAWAGEAMSYRWAFLLLPATFVGVAVWARAVGMGVGGVLVLYASLVVITLVTTKIRTECGLPFSYIGPATPAVVVVMLGSIPAFGPNAVLFSGVIAWFVGQTPFFMMPGAQMELIELGRRFRVRPRHLVVACLLGVVGGLVFGGWGFLSYSYGLGGQTIKYQWAYTPKTWRTSFFVAELNKATADYTEQQAAAADGAEADEGWMTPSQWGLVAGAAATAAVAILRQIFPAFWFHPVGILMSFGGLAQMIWGSCVVAWGLRMVVLHFGGAATVRSRLQPFFVGVFVGTIGAHVILMAHAAVLQSRGVDHVMNWWPFLVP